MLLYEPSYGKGIIAATLNWYFNLLLCDGERGFIFPLRTMNKIHANVPINEVSNIKHIPWEVESHLCLRNRFSRLCQISIVYIKKKCRHKRSTLSQSVSVFRGYKCIQTLSEKVARVHRSDKKKI